MVEKGEKSLVSEITENQVFFWPRQSGSVHEIDLSGRSHSYIKIGEKIAYKHTRMERAHVLLKHFFRYLIVFPTLPNTQLSAYFHSTNFIFYVR